MQVRIRPSPPVKGAKEVPVKNLFVFTSRPLFIKIMIEMNIHQATLRLFKAIQISTPTPAEMPPAILERCLSHGYLLDPAIEPTEEVLTAIESVVGLSGEKANATFHKSWTIVQDSPLKLLVLQQIIHYITTYGFEELGIYRQEAVYIPAEVLQLPAIREDIPLIVIRAMPAEEILGRLISLGSGIALAPETLADIMTIIKANAYEPDFVQKIGNRELKAQLYDFYKLIPAEPVEFLRYLITQLTGESLLIKNDYLIEKLKRADGKLLADLLENAPDDLASIFFRFKPLFLALKSISHNKTFFNRLRKQANHLHQPLPEDYLNSVTAQIKQRRFNLDVLGSRVQKATIFRKIRLAYALKQRLHAGDSIVYRVRNGRGWVTGFEWADEWAEVTQQALEMVLAAIAGDIRKNVNGKTIYIPAHVYYALPATEKQFTGHLPTGSYISIPQDLMVGIHWTNTAKRVDLDLSVIGASGKIGWDAAYRSEDHSILFSGDMTDAPPPHGATELFYLKQAAQEPRILMANFFNFQVGDEVSCRLLVAHEEPANFGKNYMVDVSKIMAAAHLNITKKQTVLGLIAEIEGENRVYFAQVTIGNSITARQGDQTTQARKYLVRSMVDSLDFREVLRRAGATVVTQKPQGEYIDLSPERLDKTTIINLINPSAHNQSYDRI